MYVATIVKANLNLFFIKTSGPSSIGSFSFSLHFKDLIIFKTKFNYELNLILRINWMFKKIYTFVVVLIFNIVQNEFVIYQLLQSTVKLIFLIINFLTDQGCK